MNSWKLAVIGWYALNALLTVGTIGKKRDPLTPSVAVGTLILLAALAFCVTQA